MPTAYSGTNLEVNEREIGNWTYKRVDNKQKLTVACVML